MIQRPKNNPRNGETVVPASKELQDTEVIKQGVRVASAFWDKDGISLADYLEKGAAITTLHFSKNWSSNLSPNVEANFRKESCFFNTMLLLTRRPLRTRNWQIFTWKF
jgi:hypothetical protein